MKPIVPLNIITKASAILTGIFSEIKAIKYLSLTNLVKFVKRLLSQEIKAKFLKEVDELHKLTEKDKLNYVDMIKVVVCNQKCPCCGRICGLENEHQYHQCIYGHQMRGLNGTYLKRDNGVKEASVVRCEQMG